MILRKYALLGCVVLGMTAPLGVHAQNSSSSFLQKTVLDYDENADGEDEGSGGGASPFSVGTSISPSESTNQVSSTGSNFLSGGKGAAPYSGGGDYSGGGAYSGGGGYSGGDAVSAINGLGSAAHADVSNAVSQALPLNNVAGQALNPGGLNVQGFLQQFFGMLQSGQGIGISQIFGLLKTLIGTSFPGAEKIQHLLSFLESTTSFLQSGANGTPQNFDLQVLNGPAGQAVQMFLNGNWYSQDGMLPASLLSLNPGGYTSNSNYSLNLDRYGASYGNVTGSAQSAAVYQMARSMVGWSTANMAGTNGGRLACAGAVNEVVRRATGQPVGGGLSTASMYQALRSGRGTLVPLNQAPPGAIIISPTQGSNTGHVGIIGENGLVYSNSSSRAAFSQNFTISSWVNYYQGQKGLPVYAFVLN